METRSDASPEAEWITADSKDEALLRYVQEHAVPRPHAILHQLKVDLSTPVSLLMWSAVLLFLVLGIADRDPMLLAFPTIAIPLFGRTFVQLVRGRRSGQLKVVRIDNVKRTFRDLGLFSGRIQLEGVERDIEIVLMAKPADELIAEFGAVEALTLLPLQSGNRQKIIEATAIAVRPAKSCAGFVAGTLPNARVAKK